MNYNYLVPANSKKQSLLLGFLDKTDVPILVVGGVVTAILLLLLNLNSIIMFIIGILPLLVAVFLVFPMPNYHNVRIFLHEMYLFYFVRRKKYVWRGWCYKYEQSDE